MNCLYLKTLYFASFLIKKVFFKPPRFLEGMITELGACWRTPEVPPMQRCTGGTTRPAPKRRGEKREGHKRGFTRLSASSPLNPSARIDPSHGVLTSPGCSAVSRNYRWYGIASKVSWPWRTCRGGHAMVDTPWSHTASLLHDLRGNAVPKITGHVVAQLRVYIISPREISAHLS